MSAGGTSFGQPPPVPDTPHTVFLQVFDTSIKQYMYLNVAHILAFSANLQPHADGEATVITLSTELELIVRETVHQLGEKLQLAGIVVR